MWLRSAELKQEEKDKQILINTNLVSRDEVMFLLCLLVKMSKQCVVVTFGRSRGGEGVGQKPSGAFLRSLIWWICGRKCQPSGLTGGGGGGGGGERASGVALSRSLQRYVAEEVGH